MKRKKSLPPLDRLKNLRWTGGPSRESDWSRNIPVIWWFSSHYLLRNPGLSLSLTTLCLAIDISYVLKWLIHLGIHFMRGGKVTGICCWTLRLALTLAKHKWGDIRKTRHSWILDFKPVSSQSLNDSYIRNTLLPVWTVQSLSVYRPCNFI